MSYTDALTIVRDVMTSTSQDINRDYYKIPLDSFPINAQHPSLMRSVVEPPDWIRIECLNCSTRSVAILKTMEPLDCSQIAFACVEHVLVTEAQIAAARSHPDYSNIFRIIVFDTGNSRNSHQSPMVDKLIVESLDLCVSQYILSKQQDIEEKVQAYRDELLDKLTIE